MSDRSLIFNAKGVQIGYIEADRAFDLAGRERCKYARATGNLSELNSEKIVGHLCLDGTFAGLSWTSEELFGKPSGEVHPARTMRNQRPRYRPRKPNPQWPENLGVKEPEDVPPPTATTSPQPENAVKDSQPIANAETGLNISEKAADEPPEHHPSEPIIGASDRTKSTADDELLGRAIGMIRSALEKGAE
jgi:hypothetical protein